MQSNMIFPDKLLGRQRPAAIALAVRGRPCVFVFAYGAYLRCFLVMCFHLVRLEGRDGIYSCRHAYWNERSTSRFPFHSTPRLPEFS